MQTVSTLCASGTALSLSAVGLTLARSAEDLTQRRNENHENTDNTAPIPRTRPPTSKTATSPLSGMTAVTNYHSVMLPHAHELAFDRRQSYPSTITRPQTASRLPMYESSEETRAHERHVSIEGARDLHTPIDFVLENELDSPHSQDRKEAGLVTNGQIGSRPLSWLRRLSSSMSTSRESSRTPTSQTSSRPSSALFSSGDGFTTGPIRSDSSVQELLNSTSVKPTRNRLVKRTASLRGSSSSPLTDSSRSSRLPILKRPVTSHQRSMYANELRLASRRSDNVHHQFLNVSNTDEPLHAYFTPHVPLNRSSSTPTSSISGIPNPIRRVYPDRKYTPMLVSASVSIRPAHVETDVREYDFDIADDDSLDMDAVAASKTASLSQPASTAQLRHSPPPRRSFSIADLLSTGPQTFWKATPGKKTPTNKLLRRVRPRVFSLPSVAMANSFSKSVGSDSDRPSKRRDVTDPTEYSRSIYTSSSDATADTRQTHELRLPSESTAGLSSYSVPVSPNVALSSPDRCVTPVGRNSPSVPANLSISQSTRASAAQSEVPSTIGSDSEPLSLSDYSIDYQNDTTCDSFPARASRSSFGKRGPPIDTIFDESPPTFSSGRSTRLRDFLSDGHYYGSDMGGTYRHSTIEEEGSILSTPVRSVRDHSVTSTPSARPAAQTVFASSPPSIFFATNTDADDDGDDLDWDFPNSQDLRDTTSRLDIDHDRSPLSARTTPLHLMRLPHLPHPMSSHSTPHRGGLGGTERTTLFDWSEQQPSPSRGTHSPPRPKTVHGKKDAETRGSRTTGRRAPSGMHARSHSVPVVPEADGKRNVAVANKFGTWGVGSKGVTEDWNDDFDFDDAPELPTAPSHSHSHSQQLDGNHEMFVPRTIREQQANVVANISLLREWGLLIEELKDLRMRAAAIGMLSGSFAPAWQEVDAMIELADQETEEETLEPRMSPPSSPGFDDSAFDDSVTTPERDHLPHRLQDQRSSPRTDEDPMGLGLLPESSPSPSRRPRKNSEAIARMVIEALQSKRSFSEVAALRRGGIDRKVPFDTATLRHIVPYVNGLKRRVKEALRETEGLYTSPHRRNMSQQNNSAENDMAVPAFHTIFATPERLSVAGPSRRGRATSESGDDVFADSEPSGIIGRLEALRIPP